MRFADLQPPSQAERVLKPAREISQLLKHNPDTQYIFLPHWLLDVYRARPDELEDVSLHELLGWYERERLKTGNESLHVKGFHMHLRRRTAKPYIITRKVTNPQQSEGNKEQYFYQLLKLFKPWRAEADLCLAGHSYHDTYVNEKHGFLEMQRYHEANTNTTEQDQEEEKAITERAERITAAQEKETTTEDRESVFEGCRVDVVQSAMQDVIDTHVRSVSRDNEHSDQLSADYNQLNADQKRIVDTVVSSLCSNRQPLHLIVSGQGGTRKSRVIDILNRLISAKVSNAHLLVVTAAPTGLAAFNIGGTTIHRLLSLPVEHGKPADYCRLQQEQLTLLRATLKGVRLLIIDEVSMVSSITLLSIHMRLTEIMCSNQLFGSINIVFFCRLSAATTR